MRPVFLLWLLAFSSLAYGSRQIHSFNEGWLFYQGDPGSASSPDFNDSDWASIHLPHTWNADDGQSPDYYRGPGWYRKHFRISTIGKRRVFVKFDAANLVAEIFLNGISLGTHRGGYTAFVFDLTSSLAKGENVIAVRVDNSKNWDVPPLRADYTFFGGLYRNAWLIYTDPVHFSFSDGASGIVAEPVQVSKDKAVIRVETRLSNDSSENFSLTQIMELEGALLGESRQRKIVSGRGTARLSQTITVPSPHLWDGIRDPFLYPLKITLVDSQGLVVDSLTIPLGLRSVRVSADKGVFLNGRHVELRGVSLHQDWKGRGWALSDRERRENIKILREMGTNAVRLSHYPRADEELDLLDEQGILAWSENPLINDINASEAFQKNASDQLRELIRQKGNHPSILFWGLFNEVHDDPVGLIPNLNAVAHKEDPIRPTAAASDLEPGNAINSHTDLIGFNMYYGWYPASNPGSPGFGGEAKDFGPAIDEAHRLFAGKAVGLTEYGAGGSFGQHQVPPMRPLTTSRFHPEEWQALVHESYFEQFKKRPFIFTHFAWNLIDFASPIRKEGSELGINDKGLVTYDRKHKKQAFYFYKAHWNPEPMVYLTSKGAAVKSGSPFTAKVYSNQDGVELFVDGKSAGTVTPRAGVIFDWPGLVLEPGSHRIEARAYPSSGDVLTDEGKITIEN